MHIPFYKYQGTGNDFIMVDNRKAAINHCHARLIRQLCDRHRGIGADGLIFINKHHAYDFEIDYHNSDGSPGFCGNGSRCAVHLAHQLGIITEKTNFLAIDGPHHARIHAHLIHVYMNDVTEIQPLPNGYWLHTGAPHYVQLVTDCDSLHVYQEGRSIRNNPRFLKEGVNVNFVQMNSDHTLFVRTYEQGVEDETLSCGTGVTAAAIVAAMHGYTSPITAHTKGGTLQVGFTKKGHNHFQDICLAGPATMVFRGEIDTNCFIDIPATNNLT